MKNISKFSVALDVHRVPNWPLNDYLKTILEAFVEFDNIMTVKDTNMAGELIEYEVTRFATEIVNAEGEDYSIDSKGDADMDDMTEMFFNSVIGRQSTVSMDTVL